jgi:LAO/AO transport system kinase
MRLIDDGLPEANAALRQLFPKTGKAYVIGITGSPGAGKSTLTNRLIAHYRKAGKSVAVIAVDPTSPFTGGAILGDRIRMQDHATDPQVFIRSLATRGNLGGLSRATGDCVRVMDALGREVIIVETVGVGQDEVEISQLAHTTCVLLVPGMGDDIQAIKAGILEVADVFVVNKADIDGADRVVRELNSMLELRHAGRPKFEAAGKTAKTFDEWEPPILKVVAAKDQGVDALVEAIERHRAHLSSTPEGVRRDHSRAATQFVALLRDRLLKAGLERLEREKGNLGEVARKIAERTADPYALADELAKEA